MRLREVISKTFTLIYHSSYLEFHTYHSLEWYSLFVKVLFVILVVPAEDDLGH